MRSTEANGKFAPYFFYFSLGENVRGLVIKMPHIDRILSGLKTWEIRSSATKIRGRIALIQSGSGQVIGLADLVDCIKLGPSDLAENFNKHLAERIDYKQPHAWVLSNARRIDPVAYKHPQGAIIWVLLPDVTASLLDRPKTQP